MVNKWKVPYVDLGKQWLSIKDQALPRISEILESGMYLEHPIVEILESKIATRLGVKFAATLNSGTDALILSLAALGIGRGDEVITVPNSFIASVSAIEHVGAKAIFVDVTDDHLMDVSLIEEQITVRTKAIMPVHLEGKMVDMMAVNEIARKYGILVIEDAAQAFGSKFLDQHPGSLSDVACFSFHPLKNLNAAGDGGLVVSNNEEIILRVKQLKSHGQVKRNHSNEFGFVSRLDSIQAAILDIKLNNLDSIINQRRLFATDYDHRFSSTSIQTPITQNEVFHSYHLYVIELNERDRVQRELESFGIETKVHYPILITDQRAYLTKYPDQNWHIPKAKQQSAKILSLPIHQNLDESQIEYVSKHLLNIVRKLN